MAHEQMQVEGLSGCMPAVWQRSRHIWFISASVHQSECTQRLLTGEDCQMRCVSLVSTCSRSRKGLAGRKQQSKCGVGAREQIWHPCRARAKLHDS